MTNFPPSADLSVSWPLIHARFAPELKMVCVFSAGRLTGIGPAPIAFP
jgi:hypothetical protein